ncbi:MAG: tetratricopeptide repeat protein [Smithella sp.]|jgi:tetratricopeptide (TPR) repeat protein
MKNKNIYLVVILLIVVSCIAFGRIADNGFINFDDQGYITQNNHVQSGINLQSIKWAATSVVAGNWHPLTMISHTLDWSIFGANASGHHLVSLFLHIGAVIFLFLFLNKTTDNVWAAAFAAAFFALHPLRVESVAWASERKDVLSMFFGMAALYTYAFYAKSLKSSPYFLCITLFILSLLSKPMLVTLPFAMLLLDYWPLGRWTKTLTPPEAPIAEPEKKGKKKKKKSKAEPMKEQKATTPAASHSSTIGRLLWEKAPFIFLAFLSSATTLWAQNKDELVVPLQTLPFALRVQNTFISYIAYIEKTFWPVDLAMFYPYEYPFPFWHFLASFIILIGCTVMVVFTLKKLPFLFVGWFWYLGTLIPVIGLVQVGGQAMANRYTYLPSIGLALILAWGLPHFFPREDIRKKILWPVAVTVLFMLTIFTFQQCGYWKDSITLYSHTLQVTKDNALAHKNIGMALAEKGKFEEAFFHYNKALLIVPGDAGIYYNRGSAYNELGQYHMAIDSFNKTLLITPKDAKAFYNRGFAYSQLGQYQMAIDSFDKAIELNPEDADAYYNRGNAYAKGLGRYERSIENYNEVIRLKPNYAEAYTNRGISYFNLGNRQSGCRDVQTACTLGNCRIWETVRSRGYCR